MMHAIFTIMPTFVILFWLLLFVLDDNKNKSKKFFMVFLSVVFINYAIHWCYFNHNYKIYHILESFWVFTSLSVFPLFYYYIRYLSKDIKIDYRWVWILLPAVALALFTGILYVMMSQEEIEIFINEVLYHNKPLSEEYSTLIKLQLFRIELFKVIFSIEVIITIYFGLKLIRQFNEKLKVYYSDIHNKELKNIKTMLFVLLATAIVSFLSNIVGKDFFVDEPYLLALPSITHSIALFGVSYVGYKQSFSVRELNQEQLIHDNEKHLEKREAKQQTEKVEVNECESINVYEELYEKMEYLLKQEQIFKDSDLRLNDLALMLGTNRTYISRLINNKENTNFCDYVNSHRVIYAKEMLSSSKDEHLSISEIALESGFSNQSSFYRVFTKMEGTSPAKYRKKEITT